MFSILTRTANRPKLFEDCRKSVVGQTVPAFHIVSTDDPTDTYPEGDKIVKVPRLRGRGHNLYLNIMRLYVPAGSPWVIALDDDDQFCKPGALEIISKYTTYTGNLILWRVQMPGRVVPSEINSPPVFGDITGIGFCIHVKNWINWPGIPGADFHVINKHYLCLNPVWIDDILTSMQQIGHGKKTDK